MKPSDFGHVHLETESSDLLEQVNKELKKKKVQITILKKIIAKSNQSSPNPKKT
ncbi:MAG: hypothetical protein NT040_11795 [Bacteroidetes bacterium]|nr:hypothetical protein [Bacteroidota bacterium]